jgi:hypothetical protein
MNKRYEKLLADYERHAALVRKVTEVDIFESTQQRKKRITELESSYSKWFEYYFPHYAKSPCAPFHIELADRVLAEPVSYTIANWFRGAAKSVHVCMGLPLFLMVKGELNFMLLVGQTADKAKLLLSDVQIQLSENKRFINDYGQQFKFGDWAEGSFTTKQDVHFMAIGIGQSPRGARHGAERPDYIVCDDVDTKKRCNNPRLVREAVDWIMEDLWGCFDKGRERFILSNNRISKTSIVDSLRKEFRIAATRAWQEGYAAEHLYSRIIAHDENFNSAWPEKYSSLYWKKKKLSRPSRAYRREYLDDPVVEGTIFKSGFLRWGAIAELANYDSLCMYGDLSYKNQGDFKALRFWGKMGREYHLLHCYVRQSSRREAAVWLYDLYEDWQLRKFNVRYMIDGLFAQDEFINDFEQEGERRGYYIDIVPDKRPKEAKFDRIESMLGAYELRRVMYNEAFKDSPDFEEGTAQLLAFEKGANAPDDAPDADHGAWQELERHNFTEKFIPRIARRIKKGLW